MNMQSTQMTPAAVTVNGLDMQAAADILRQKVPHEDHLSLHVNGLVALSGIVHTLFPDGSEGGDALLPFFRGKSSLSINECEKELEHALYAVQRELDALLKRKFDED